VVGFELLKMPRVQPLLREFERRKQEEGWETAKDQILLTRAFLDELFIQRLVNMKTHPKVGDLAIAKMFETGYTRTGDIQPTRISAEAKADATSQLYAKRLYLPDWRREIIEEIQRAERESAQTGLPCKTVNASDVLSRRAEREGGHIEFSSNDVNTSDQNPNDPQAN